MEIKQITATNAHETMQGTPRVIYLDVRTAREFEHGHPPGAFNIPVVFIDSTGGPARPNEDFLDIVRLHISVGTPIIVGCQSGVRSQRAAELLAAAGYRDVLNLQGGFGGARDRTGRLVAPGWRDSGLPVETGQPDERSYEALRAKAAK